MSFSASSQDSIKIEVNQAKKVLAAAKQRDVLLEQVGVMTQRINEKQEIVKLLKEKSQNDSLIIVTYESEIGVMKKQRTLDESQIKNLEKIVKRERTKRTITGALGIAATVAAFLIGMGK